MLCVLLATTLGVSSQFAESPMPKGPITIASVLDYRGRPVAIPDKRAKATVLIFVTVDCPIANRYAPEIARILKRYEPKGCRFALVYVDPSSKAGDIAAHRKAYGLSCAGILDPRHRLVGAFGARVTPQAAVLSPAGYLLYRGRIDDLYAEHARMKDPPYRRDLRIALDEVLAGRRVEVTQTAAVGCAIPEIAKGAVPPTA